MAKKARKSARKTTTAKRSTARKSTKRGGQSSKKGGLAGLFKPVKQSVTIRLDSDVVSWFKKKADKYQTEINSVLRKHMSRG